MTAPRIDRRRRAALAALALSITVAAAPVLAARPPQAGGSVTILISGGEVAGAIAEALDGALTQPAPIGPDGAPLVRVAGDADRPRRVWTLDVRAPIDPAELARRLAEHRWDERLESVDVDTAGPPRIHLRFASPVCVPMIGPAVHAVRHGAGGEPLAPFRKAREGWYRAQENAAARPLLDDIFVAVTRSTPPPGPDEIVVRPRVEGERSDVTVAYRLVVRVTDAGATRHDEILAALRARLRPLAFDPLVPPAARSDWIVEASAPAVTRGDTLTAPIAVRVAPRPGTDELGTTVARRARVLLETGGFDTGDEPDALVDIERRVLLAHAPAFDVPSDPRGPERAWTVLALGYVVDRGPNVGGRLAEPSTLYRLEPPPPR